LKMKITASVISGTADHAIDVAAPATSGAHPYFDQ